jgi:4-amino-4-deoxy-L-arabinose transferase-like glycosyltransferase
LNRIKGHIVFIALSLFYLATRLVNLTIIPIFTDEALYLRWAQWGLGEPKKYLFISLLDGKQPLFIWLTYPFLTFFSDPLVGGRLVSVLAGLLTVLFLYLTADLIFTNKKIALFASLFYIIFPFAVINDRLALYDTLLAMLGIASIYFQIRLVKKCDFKISIILGLAMGLGFLTKSSASFFLLFSPLPLFFLPKKNIANLINWGKHFILAVVIATLVSSILYISPLHGMVKAKNEVFLLTFSQFLSNPFYGFLGNIRGLISYFPPYFSDVWIAIILLAMTIEISRIIKFILKFGFKLKIKTMEKRLSDELIMIYLFTLFFFPFVSLAFFAKIIYPRFIFFMTLPLLLILAFYTNWLIEKVKFRFLKFVLVFFIFIFSAYNSFLILTNPTSAYLPQADSDQLLNSWPAGYGVKQVVEYIKSRPPTQQIYLATEGTEGLFPHALEIYLYRNANVQIKGYWPVTDIPLEVREMARIKETYFIYKDTLNPRPQQNVQEILRVRRGIGDNWLVLLKVLK